jgi:hypothetical protein
MAKELTRDRKAEEIRKDLHVRLRSPQFIRALGASLCDRALLADASPGQAVTADSAERLFRPSGDDPSCKHALESGP